MSEVRGGQVVDVIVVGAGPVGLWLAAELGRAAVDVLVLEKLAEPALLDHAMIFQATDDTLTLEELRESTTRVAGTDFGMYDRAI
jgi:2-polyprenyl-6-methoxyphenol hydroxylase-like FAD-dependent oxidoreductase